MCTVNMQSDSCYEMDVLKELVKIAKQATMNYNRVHRVHRVVMEHLR